jgi:hypothetical protein
LIKEIRSLIELLSLKKNGNLFIKKAKLLSLKEKNNRIFTLKKQSIKVLFDKVKLLLDGG